MGSAATLRLHVGASPVAHYDMHADSKIQSAILVQLDGSSSEQ